jgi:nitrite reductase/ring-hydroxylating ferredoxin subunit
VRVTDRLHLDRRALLGCAALYGVAGPVLVACSSDRGNGRGESGDPGDPGDADASDPASSPEAGDSLVAAADVPLGGGVALTDLRIVVTQPSRGEFKAFSGVCTHQGGAITRVEDSEMVCSLHQSRFAVTDGGVVQGPATNPLPEVRVKVEGGQVVRA